MNQKNRINPLLLKLLVSVLTITGCLHNRNANKTTKKKTHTISPIQTKSPSKQNIQSKEEHVITIWVHGTRFGPIQDFIFKNFFYRKQGLHPVSSFKDVHNNRKIAVYLCTQKTKRFKLENFYIFGWSGDLSPKKRQEAALQLYKAILNQITQYKKKHNREPKIRLITHSHGGNVALGLSRINDRQPRKISIYELILLACPVQQQTESFIKNKMFETIYSLYSGVDILQVIDPQGIHGKPKLVPKTSAKQTPFFSKRRFKPQKNVIQVKLKINGRGILHLEFLLKRFISLMPHLLDELDSWRKAEIGDLNAYKKQKLIKINTKENGIQFERKIMKQKKIKTSIKQATLLLDEQLRQNQSLPKLAARQDDQNEASS